MSDRDAYESEMRRFSRMTDQELDLLFTGRTPGECSELDGLAATLHEVGLTYRAPLDSDTQDRHLAAIHEASRLLAGTHTAAPTTAGNASEATIASVSARGRRRLVLHNPLTSMAAKIAAAFALAFVAFGGTAYAGVLPNDVQKVVSEVGDTVGVPIPDGDDGQVNDVDDGQVGDTDDGQVNDTDDGQVGDTDDGQVGDVDDGQVNDTDDGQVGDVDDGQVDDTDDGQVGDVDDGQVNGDVDDGQVDGSDDGQVGDTDDGQVGGRQWSGQRRPRQSQRSEQRRQRRSGRSRPERQRQRQELSWSPPK